MRVASSGRHWVELMETTDQNLLEILTSKQRQVLDLLVEHKTSKEIGIALGISHNTVDQHINICRNKLGASNRRDLAKIYNNLRMTYQQTIYGQIRIENSILVADNKVQNGSENLLIDLESSSDNGSKFQFNNIISIFINFASRHEEKIVGYLAAIVILLVLVVNFFG